jgi:hypothetical protein
MGCSALWKAGWRSEGSVWTWLSIYAQIKTHMETAGLWRALVAGGVAGHGGVGPEQQDGVRGGQEVAGSRALCGVGMQGI